jgi:hypothetical protein
MSVISEFRVIGERFKGEYDPAPAILGLIKRVEPPLVRTVQKGETYETTSKDTR